MARNQDNNDQDGSTESQPDVAAPAPAPTPDDTWTTIPPLGTPHEPKADPQFTIEPAKED